MSTSNESILEISGLKEINEKTVQLIHHAIMSILVTDDHIKLLELYSNLNRHLLELSSRYKYSRYILGRNGIAIKQITSIEKSIELIIRKLKETGHSYFQNLDISENETVNGYNLFNISVDQLIDYFDFKEIKEQWIHDKEYSKSDFIDECHTIACTDWSKMDEFGNSFGGYWDYPIGTYERDHAYNLTKERNFEKLWELPYPKSVIIKTIELGCSNRMECVRYSNFVCEWIKRKMEKE